MAAGVRAAACPGVGFSGNRRSIPVVPGTETLDPELRRHRVDLRVVPSGIKAAEEPAVSGASREKQIASGHETSCASTGMPHVVRMNKILALLIAGALSLGAARANVGTVQVAEDRVENLVDVLNGFDKQQNNVVVIIVRGEIKLEITNVQSARGDRRLLTIDYVSTADSKTYRAAVDVTDVLLVEERPK